MSREWKEVKLGDFIEIKHGFAYKGANFSKEETSRILLTPGNFNIGGGFKSDKFKYYDEDAENPSEYILKPNDLLITMTDLSNSGDTLGFPVFIPKIENKIILHNQRTGKVIAKSLKIDMSFIYYLLCTREYRHHVLSTATGTTVRHTAPKRIESYKFNLPPLKEQKAIAHILSTLDEKIETNNQINKKLEEMAQTIFKHWFVDFEFPNEDGEPYKSSGGEMVESEFGMIPQGWEVVKLSELGNVITGKTPSTKQIENFGDRYNFITPRDIDGNIFILKTERLLSEIGADKLRTVKIKKNSIGVSCIGSNLGEVYVNAEDSFTNQQINSITLYKEEMYSFIYIILKNMKEDFLNLAGGSAVPIINKTTFSDIRIVKPSDLLLTKFVNITGRIFQTIKKNLIENDCLSGLRDTFLPKLMSGEIRVPLEKDEIL